MFVCLFYSPPLRVPASSGGTLCFDLWISEKLEDLSSAKRWLLFSGPLREARWEVLMFFTLKEK